MSEILRGDDSVLISESLQNLREKVLKWKERFESKGLKINLKKTKVLVSDLKEEILKGKVDPRAKCGKRAMKNSVLCTKCGKWVHGRCAKMKKVTSTLAKSFVCEIWLEQKRNCQSS